MDMDAMNQLSYGLFVLTAHQNGKDNGSIINTAIQLTVEPNRIAMAVDKKGLTHDMVLATSKFTVSILSEEADASLIRQFGFVSGKQVDKFADFKYCKRVSNGTLAITRGTNAYISAMVEQTVDLGSHTLFIALVTDGAVWNHLPSATYAFYHKYIKKQFQQAAQSQSVQMQPEQKELPPSGTEGKALWRCKVCGYVYDPVRGDPNHGIPAGTAFEDLPEDWVCPLCGMGKDAFEKV